jgi:hypothetical protein
MCEKIKYECFEQVMTICNGKDDLWNEMWIQTVYENNQVISMKICQGNEWEYFMVIWDEKNGHEMICKGDIQNDVKMIKLKWQCTEQVMSNRMNENV